MADGTAQGPDVRSLQTLTGATSAWLWSASLGLWAVAMVLHAVQLFINHAERPLSGTTVPTGVFHILMGVAGAGLAVCALRLGFQVKRGQGTDGFAALAWAAAGLLVVMGAYWIYLAGAEALAVFEGLRTPGVMLIVCAILVGGIAYLARGSGQARAAASLLASLSAVLLLVAGQSSLAWTWNDVALPFDLTSGMALVVIAAGAGLAWIRPTARPVAWFIVSLGAILFAIHAILTMSDILGTNPFGGAPGTRPQPWMSASMAWSGVAGILFGLAGVALLICAILSLVVNGPALAAAMRAALAAPSSPNARGPSSPPPSMRGTLVSPTHSTSVRPAGPPPPRTGMPPRVPRPPIGRP